jgi:hypothetical protein
MSFQTIYYINNGGSEHFRPLLYQELSEPPFNARKYFGAPPLTEKIFLVPAPSVPPHFFKNYFANYELTRSIVFEAI